MRKIIQCVVVVACIVIICSCQSSSRNQIKTATDWVAYCQGIGDPLEIVQTEGVEAGKECFIKVDNGFKSIKCEDVPVILEELVLQISTGDVDNPQMKDKCYACTWLIAAYTAHTTYLEDNFTEGQKNSFCDILNYANNPIFSGKMGILVGEAYNPIIVTYPMIFSKKAKEDLIDVIDNAILN